MMCFLVSLRETVPAARPRATESSQLILAVCGSDMALVRGSFLCRGLGVHRQTLLECWTLQRGSARPCSGPGKELASNITRREQQQQDSGDNYGRIGRAGES